MNAPIQIEKEALSKLADSVRGSFEGIAKKTGYSASYVSLVMNGTRRITDKNMVIIQEAFKVLKRVSRTRYRLQKVGDKITKDVKAA